MIAVIDYGMGNLRSVAKAVERVGGRARIVSEPEAVLAAEKIILPGVGAFGDAMAHLRERNLVDAIRQVIAEDRPVLGICLGLQLLFDVGWEDGRHEGLGILGGKVIHFDFAGLPEAAALSVPHMGWNTLGWDRSDPMLDGVEPGSYVYFVHSYHVVPDDPAIEATRTDYGYRFTSSIRRGNLFACQFHPEKSQRVGLRMVENFVSGRLAGQ
ncbi:MAG: imidazole glycerol phosphate synthase subunit HisH [Planctomycetes bacterium]|nr:imidazole glycerol phosphate synthase subunit HisH [Planctomycetota bacterium]